MQIFSTQTDVQKTVDATNQVETSLQAYMELPDIKNAQTQTEGTLRELQGLDKALQRTRGELTNNLSKLTELDKDIARQKQKLQEAEVETSKRDIRSRIKNLEDERTARLEAASANKEELRGQINSMRTEGMWKNSVHLGSTRSPLPGFLSTQRDPVLDRTT